MVSVSDGHDLLGFQTLEQYGLFLLLQSRKNGPIVLEQSRIEGAQSQKVTIDLIDDLMPVQRVHIERPLIVYPSIEFSHPDVQ